MRYVTRIFGLLLLLTALGACAHPAGKPAPTLDRHLLHSRLTALPGAQVSTQPLAVYYPGETLFATGAALPLPGGTTLLAPLANLLAETPGWRWRGMVRGDGGSSADHDRTLAAKRAELLSRYFARRGIAGERLELVPTDSAGAALELVPEALQSASPASSSREKR